MFRRLTLFSLILVAFSGFAATPRWTEVNSDHFTVLTDTSEKQGKEVAVRFEQMRIVFGNMFRRAKVNIAVPLQILALRSHKEVLQYGPTYKGKPVDVSGFFQGSNDRNFIVIDMSSSDPYSTVFHEYAHLLLGANLPPMPIWFNEGFAEYFAGLKVNGKEMEYANVSEGRLQSLRNDRWLRLADLFSAQPNSAAYNERDKRGIFYAQSWLVVHWIYANQKIPETMKYLQLTQIEKVPVADAVQNAFGMDINALEKTVRRYFESGQMKYYKAPAPEVESGPLVTKKVDDLTAQATLADLHAHSFEYQDKALAELQDILRQDPANPVANRALGYLQLRRGEFDEASALFNKVAQVDTKDAQVHYLNALLMNRVALKLGRPPANAELMKQELQTAIELDPALADAYNLLAFALGAEKKFDGAISAQKKAIELNQSMELYQVNLAGLYVQAQEWDKAEAILKRLAESQDQQIRDLANQNLAALQSNREFAAEESRMKELRRGDLTAPQWRPKEGEKAPSIDELDQSKPDTRKVVYLRGELKYVDCSADPMARVFVMTGKKVMVLRAENYKKLLVMGADEFSCGWKNKKVLVNYKPGGKADGDIVTLELQAGK